MMDTSATKVDRMDKRSKVISTAISAKEYEILRRMAYEKNKTISSLVRDMLRGVEERPSFSPDVTKMMAATTTKKARQTRQKGR